MPGTTAAKGYEGSRPAAAADRAGSRSHRAQAGITRARGGYRLPPPAVRAATMYCGRSPLEARPAPSPAACLEKPMQKVQQSNSSWSLASSGQRARGDRFPGRKKQRGARRGVRGELSSSQRPWLLPKQLAARAQAPAREGHTRGSTGMQVSRRTHTYDRCLAGDFTSSNRSPALSAWPPMGHSWSSRAPIEARGARRQVAGRHHEAMALAHSLPFLQRGE